MRDDFDMLATTFMTIALMERAYNQHSASNHSLLEGNNETFLRHLSNLYYFTNAMATNCHQLISDS